MNPKYSIVAARAGHVCKYCYAYTDVMNTHPLLKVETSQRSIAKRIQLAEDLWDSILEQQLELPLADVQQQEPDQRLERYQHNPTSGSTWEDVKRRSGFSQ